MSTGPDEPLVALVRGLALHHQTDTRLAAHIERLADDLALKLQSLTDESAGTRLWADDYFFTLARMIAHLGSQQVQDRLQVDLLTQALLMSAPGFPVKLANFQQFAHDVYSQMGEQVGQNVNPLMAHIIRLQERSDSHDGALQRIRDSQTALLEALKDVQQSNLILRERLGDNDHGAPVL